MAIVVSSKVASREVDIPVKVVIDKEKKRVVFTEADGDFADILFSFLTLPMGTIVRLLANHSDQSKQLNIGNFNTLCSSVMNLDAKYFVTDVSKDLLANTRNLAEYECRRLKINIDDTKPAQHFICQNLGCTVDQDFPSLSTCNIANCRHCGDYLNMPINYIDDLRENNNGVFFAQTASFIISDDLYVYPNTVGSTLVILETAGISDFGVLEEATLQFGSHEILELLKYSIFSKTPLSDMVFGKKDIVNVKDIVLAPSFQCRINTEHIYDFINMTVKVLVQKSNKKILLAQTEEDFVEFLFGFLAMPLGRIITFLGESFSSNGTVENLHNSLSNLDVGRYFKFDELRQILLYPEVDFGSYHSLYFRKEWSRDFYYGSKCDSSSKEDTYHLTRKSGRVMKIEHPKEYVRGPTMFLVTDDLVATPFSSMSCITYLHSLKVSPSDVEEYEINIGPEEALNLLRACMISTSVLNSGLNSFMLNNQQRMEVGAKQGCDSSLIL